MPGVNRAERLFGCAMTGGTNGADRLLVGGVMSWP
jgi:hypothetical protein